MSEKQIQKAVLEYLNYHPKIGWAERINVGAHVVVDKNSRRFIRYAFKGCSDVLGQLKSGRLLAVEVKSKNGKLTNHQRDFLKKVKEYGGVALVVRSVDELESQLNIIE